MLKGLKIRCMHAGDLDFAAEPAQPPKNGSAKIAPFWPAFTSMIRMAV